MENFSTVKSPELRVRGIPGVIGQDQGKREYRGVIGQRRREGGKEGRRKRREGEKEGRRRGEESKTYQKLIQVYINGQSVGNYVPGR